MECPKRRSEINMLIGIAKPVEELGSFEIPLLSLPIEWDEVTSQGGSYRKVDLKDVDTVHGEGSSTGSWENIPTPKSGPTSASYPSTVADKEFFDESLSPDTRHACNPRFTADADFFKNVVARDIDAIQAKLDIGANIVTETLYCNTPLVLSIQGQQVEMTRWLLENNADVEYQVDGLPPLVHAVKNAQFGLSIVQLLVEYGADIRTISGPDDMNILHWAVTLGAVDSVDFLISKGADLNSTCSNRRTPLILAAEKGHVFVTKVLLANSAAIEQRSSNGGKALAWAAYNGHLETVKLLSREVVDINDSDASGLTALSVASRMGHVEIVKFLITRGADVNNLSLERKDTTPALAAAIAGHTEVLRALISSGADLTIRNRVGDTALEAAMAHGQSGTVRVLLESLGGPDYPLDSIALRLAVVDYHEAVMAIMTSVSLMYPHVTHKTGSIEDLAWMEWTLELGGSLVRPKALQNMLCATIYEEKLELIEELLRLGANPDTHLPLRQSPLAFAINHRNLELIRILLQAGADPAKPVSDRRNEKYTPLHQALLALETNGYQDTSIVDLLVASGRCNILSGNCSTDTPFFLVLGNLDKGSHGVFEILAFNMLKQISDVNSERCGDGFTLMHVAVHGNRRDMVDILVLRGGDINAKDHQGQTPFVKECHHGRTSMLAFLIERGADPFATDDNSSTGLHGAAMNGRIGAMRRLLSFGLNIETEDNNGHTPLIAAIAAGQEKAALWLIKRHANVKVISTDKKRTLLHYVAIRDMQRVVEKLLETGDMDTNVKDYKGNTSLALACRRGSPALITTLLAHGADPESAADMNYRPLHIALEMNNEPAALHLINYGVDLTARDNRGRTPLHFAVQFANPQAAQLLLEKGVSPDAGDDNGFTPLFLSRYSDGYLTDLLIEQGADVNHLSDKGWTPLHCAVSHGNVAMFGVLLKAGADLDARTADDGLDVGERIAELGRVDVKQAQRMYDVINDAKKRE